MHRDTNMYVAFLDLDIDILFSNLQDKESPINKLNHLLVMCCICYQDSCVGQG